jgi:hypothetical protein
MSSYIADIRFQWLVPPKSREEVHGPFVLLLPMQTLGSEHLWPCDASECSHGPGPIADRPWLRLSLEMLATTLVYTFLEH